MYWQPPTPDELAKYGGARRLEDFPEPVVEVYAELLEPLAMFRTISNQWRVGSNGIFALDYNVVYREFDDYGLTGDDRTEWKWFFRVIEAQALKELRRP